MSQPLTEQQLDEITERAAHLDEYAIITGDQALQSTIDLLTGTDVPALVAEIRRQRDKHKASLRRADEINNELMEEVQRYAAGIERPVLWSVYNDMHLRAANAELTLDRFRRIASRLANHAVGFGDVLDESDRGPWGRTVGADIAELSAAMAPDVAPQATSAPLAASQPSEAPVEPDTATRAPTGRLGDSGAAVDEGAQR